MDYDDNDFQGQNIHLAGEGSSKLSPVLRPYALPKFEFDDSLQGHLRFDSLVENEVFLGIPSQEDNQWIEDYSRGSSGIEFDSSAAESCSISRHNNVWSEATSSESVEMLLKSVGQEERVPEETILEESGIGDVLGNLTSQMEPSIKQDDALHSQNASPSDVYVSTGGVLQNLQAREVELSNSELGSKFVSEPFEEKNDSERDDANQVINDSVVNESPAKEMPKHLFISSSQCGDTDSSSELNTQESSQQVSDICMGNANNLPETKWKSVEEQGVMGSAVNMDGQLSSASTVEIRTHNVESSLCFTSKVESMGSQLVGISISNVEVATNSILKGDCDSQVAEGCNVDMTSDEPSPACELEAKVSSNFFEINQQPQGSTHLESPLVSVGGETSGVDAIVLDISTTEIPDHSELKMDSLTQITVLQGDSFQENEDAAGIDGGQDRGALVNSPDTSIISVLGNKESEPCDGQSIDHASDPTNLMTAYTSEDLFVVKTSMENHETYEVESNAEGHISPTMLSGSEQIHQENPSSELNDVHRYQDVCDQGAGIATLSKESSDVECTLAGALHSPKKVVSTSSGENIVDIVVAQGSDSLMRTETETAVKETNAESCETLNALQTSSGSNTRTNVVTDPDDQPKSPILGVRLQHLDDKEGMEVDREASPLNGGSQDSGVLNPVSEVKEDTSPDSAVQHEKGDHCGAVLDNFHMDKGEQSAGSEEIGHECSKELEASPIPCDSSIKERDEAGAVRLENPKETKMERNDGVQHPPVELLIGKESGCQTSVDPSRPSESDINQAVDGSISVGLDKHECGSPTIISCVEPSHNVKTYQEEGKGAMIDAVPISDVTDNLKGNIQSISKNVTDHGASEGERSFTFEVGPSAGLGDAVKIVEGTAAKSGGGQVDPKMSLGITQSSPQTPIVGTAKVGAKGSIERKTRRKSAGKESGKRGNSVKETTTPKQWGRSEKSQVPLATSGTGQAQQFEELKSYESVDRGAMKPSGVSSIPTSNLPDLNTSVSLFQQPFTDMQQVQLRAQILVYGSLIQGTTPEEACMIAAFGPSDGGKSHWEPTWRASLERLHGRKSQANNSDTPVKSRSGITTPDSAMKRGSAQSKVPSSSTARANKKGTQPPITSPMIPLSSPLWNISTPSGDGLQAGGIPKGAPLDYHQALSPLHPYQTPPAQSFVGHNPSWLAQGGYTGQWIAAPPTYPFNFSARISTLPNTESVKLTPAKESGVPIIKHTPHIPVVYAEGSTAISGASSLPELKQATVPSGQPSGDSKSRKRKKAPVGEPHVQISLPGQTQTMPVHTPVVIDHMSNKVEGPGQIPLLAQNRTESVSAPVVSSIFTAAVAVSTTACFNSRSSPAELPSAVTPTASSDHLKTGAQNADDKVIISVETLNKVEEAKLQAEEAAKHAAAAVSHCQAVWSQLQREKSSGLVSDFEAKLASAAVSVAAAASVAKAAAAAAKIASNAAEQAKLMADEVLISSGSGNFSESRIISISNVANNLVNATPASILKGGDGSNRSSSIIVAAREAARRRIEAASAASKHAENLDAIVKAAELAAEAVSQAGKIVEMGDPLPLRELVASGPEGYWKTPQNLTSHKLNMENVEANSNASARQGSFDMETEIPKHDVPSEEVLGVVPESELGVSNTSIVDRKDYHTSGISEENIIKEGCLVEVFKDGGKFKAAWFAANVLSLKDGKAYLSYNDLQSDEEKLKEWVALEGDGTMVPRIRIAHPMTTMKFEGTRKRRRGTAMNYSWSVGDRVDAWLHNCWCEGIVTEKDKNDDTSLTVHFPAQAETLVVRAWHLRPTLIWKDGKWIEWSSSNGARSSEGDTPKEKRPKLGNPAGEDRGKNKLLVGDAPQEKRPKLGISALEAHGKDKIPTSVDHVAAGSHEEARLLPLSADQKVFNVGKNTRTDNKLGLHKTVRSGLQKEGPRVVFGVPKPGKKQKFMDVSKHYNSDRSNKNDTVKNSVNFSRYLMPQGSGPRGWKSISRSDTKEKQPAETKPRVFKSGKAQYPSSRTLSTKDSASHSAMFAPRDETMADVVKDSESNDPESGEHARKEFRSSNSEDASDGPMLVSSVAPADAPKKAPSSNARSELWNKGKLTPAVGKSIKQEVKDKSVSDGAEPRRSNRRIQPTSRLLEGLQSSLTITKIPTAPQDRSHRSRSTPKGK